MLRQNGRPFQRYVYQNVKFLTGSRGPHGRDLPSPFARKFQLSVEKIDEILILTPTRADVGFELSLIL